MSTQTPNIVTKTNPFLNKPQSGFVSPQLNSSPLTAGSAGTGGQALGIAAGSGKSTPVPSGVTIAGIPGTSVGNKPPVSSYPGYVNPASVSSFAPTGTTGSGNTGGSTAPVITLETPPQNPNPAIAPLSTMASAPTAGFTQAQNEYNTAENQLQQSKENEAGQENENSNGLIPLNFMAGRNTAIQGESLAQQNALAGTMQAAATQEGAQTAQQTAQQTGLATVAGLEAPKPGQSPATQTYNPSTGTYTPLAAGSAGTGGQSAQSALASVGQTLGGETAGAALVPLKQGLDAGQGAVANINSYLAQNPSLNSSSLNLANLASQWASGQYSGANSAQYQTLGDYLTTFATQMAPLLAPGGTVTDASRALQQSLVNGSANNQTITQVLAQLTAEANSTYNNLASGAAGGGTVAGGSSVTSVPGGTNPPSTGYTPFFSQ